MSSALASASASKLTFTCGHGNLKSFLRDMYYSKSFPSLLCMLLTTSSRTNSTRVEKKLKMAEISQFFAFYFNNLKAGALLGAVVKAAYLESWKSRVRTPLWPSNFKETKCFFPAYS